MAGAALAAASATRTATSEKRTQPIDKLTDDKGKYVAAKLLYDYDALEPVIHGPVQVDPML